MTMATDILIGSNGDLAYTGGDFVIGLADEQHAGDLCVANKGEYKQSPTTGVGIINFFHGPFSPGVREKLAREIQLQLEVDGMIRPDVQVSTIGEITIKGNYKQ